MINMTKLELSHTFSAFWLRSSVVSVLISLISDRWSMTITLIKQISQPSLGLWGLPHALGRGSGAAVLPVAAGGIMKSKHEIRNNNAITLPLPLRIGFGRFWGWLRVVSRPPVTQVGIMPIVELVKLWYPWFACASPGLSASRHVVGQR
jgi:hypothetical protein